MWTSTNIIIVESESNLLEDQGCGRVLLFESESNLFEDQGCGRVLL